MDAFYTPHGDRLYATPLTRGPWDDRFQHGGPPTALLVRAIQTLDGTEGFALVRISLTFLRPVPIGVLRATAAIVHGGRTVQRVSAVLEADGREVMTATGLRVRRAPVEGAGAADPVDWPEPGSLEPFEFPFFRNAVGYHKAIELRVAGGGFGTTPVQFWARPAVPLVAGEPTGPRERVAILADAQSGMGLPLPPERYTFVNPDLTVAFARTPGPGWIGLDIRSVAGADGAGLSQSLLVDADGVFGGASQSLVVSARPST